MKRPPCHDRLESSTLPPSGAMLGPAVDEHRHGFGAIDVPDDDDDDVELNVLRCRVDMLGTKL